MKQNDHRTHLSSYRLQRRKFLASLGVAGFGGTALFGLETHSASAKKVGVYTQQRTSEIAIYKIVSAFSGKVLDVPGFATDNGVKIQQYQDNGGTNQQWQLHLVGNALFTIISVSSGKVLDVPGFATDNGVVIQQYQDNGGANQHWSLVLADTTGNTFKIVSASSGKVLDVPGFATDDGVKIQQYQDNGGANQHWNLIQIS